MGSKRNRRAGSFKEQLADVAPRREDAQPDAAVIEAESFADVARELGTQPLADAPARVDAARGLAAATRTCAAGPSDGLAPPVFFVEDIDGWLEGRREDLTQEASRQIRRARVQDQLDLHGLSARDAQRALHGFIVCAADAGTLTVRVIVGKGRHSATGRGMLRSQIASWLTADPSAHRVRAFISARQHEGGDGVVLVGLQ
jgi:DNA-nicking Smr family endonuclease